MSLNSFKFIICLVILLAVMGLLQMIRITTKQKLYERIQVVVLLLFSYFFIGRNNWIFSLWVLVVTGICYICGLYIQRNKNKKGRVCLIFANIGLVTILGYFKYANFFVNSFTHLFFKESLTLKILLPLGISFYIFSAIAYLLDVYWARYEAEEDFINLALYIAFFPKIVSGPIVRGKVFFPQVKLYKGIQIAALGEGIQIFVFGLFKKIVLADRLGVFVGDVFYAPMAYNTFSVILAVISYSLQIYFDFSGYSDMAIGISKMLGFDFEPNFNLPYLSKNVSEFWKRWHISLSSWFQEYLYIPLGGNRQGNCRTYFNLLVVMVISGLWHGAGITFIIWGFIHGITSCINRWCQTLHREKEDSKTVVASVAGIVGTYVMVTLLWVIFRAETLDQAISVYRSMFAIHGGINQPYTWSFFSIMIIIVVNIVATLRQKKIKSEVVAGFYPILNLTKVFSLILFFTFAGLTLVLGYFGNNAFIYGAF